MDEQEKRINDFLVQVFGDILHLEENSLLQSGCRDLSVSEMHVLDAVQRGAPGETMRELAQRLRVTASTLTVAANTLEHKGYLVRRRSAEDRRRVAVELTPAAQRALGTHAAFHEELVRQACARLTPEQQTALADGLSGLHSFFAGL
jgi:DNA-binding MarR family transcriptional regulator